MPGYMTLLCNCYTCGKQMTANPHFVPCVPAHLTRTGEKEPVCRDCIERANPKRIENGLEPIEIHPDAYEAEPCP